MRKFGSILIIIGVVLIGVFVYQYYDHWKAQDKSLAEAKESVDKGKNKDKLTPDEFKVKADDSFAILEIPKLGKSLPVVEGTDPNSLKKGVGHLSESVLPGQGEQIVLSGHRDTVFREFGKIEIGDQYIVNTPYGSYTYEIRETEIVSADDTTVIRKMGEEVLVVTTCYPFRYIGDAPDRFITYAYPVGDK